MRAMAEDRPKISVIVPNWNGKRFPAGVTEILEKSEPRYCNTETGQGYFQNLAIADDKNLGVTEEFTLGEVLVSSGNACGQPSKGPLQGFFSTLARFL
jgi:hypothetical protein